MGIKNINLLLTQKCGNCIVRKNIREYSGKIIAIDISIFLYKYLYNNDDHLDGLTRQLLRLLKNGITPLYIFDGEPPKAKDEVLLNRCIRKNHLLQKKDELNKTLNDTTDIEEIKKINDELTRVSKKIIRVTSIHLKQCKELFNLFGVPYITAPGEAECLCSKLSRDGLVYGCMSEDTDILANGGKLFIRNFSPSNNYVTEYSLPNILKTLNISYEQFLEICILCGCDYTCKINGIGPISAYKYIQMFNTIDNLILNIETSNNSKFKKYKIPSQFKYKEARELFININELDTTQYKDNIKIEKPNVNDLMKYLKNNSNKLHKKYYKEIDKSLFKYYSNFVK